MVPAEFGEALVERVRNYIMVMVGGCEHSEEEGLQVESATHSAEFKVP